MRLAFAALALIIAAPAVAADSMVVAMNLGSVLAAEQFCGLSYDQSAIKEYIESNVKADDIGFANNMQLIIAQLREANNDLSLSDKTAKCAQIARVAKALRFTK